ncbi:inositol polyphosphate-5-phosphatase A-like [Thalassophryne amazonica]|uniref:inositol polyphosphate-5-phosphatase A-like n=1 Tax=Thalassophryne amazonica TaxID=390379 RepID=UPI001470AB5B|nr:inositol polyphosphate-5-phosphatase A-like [Thalassophryne amazonica]
MCPFSYPYSEDSSQGKEYMNTRCPAWCDRILMSSSARDLVLKPENEDKSVVYDNIGPNVCMGDHKPVFLSFRITAGAGKCCHSGEKIFLEAPL